MTDIETTTLSGPPFGGGQVEVRIRTSEDTKSRYLCHAHPSQLDELKRHVAKWGLFDGDDVHDGAGGERVDGQFVSSERDDAEQAFFEFVVITEIARPD